MFVRFCAGNAFMSELQSRLVPLLVEKEEFWARYFYRWAAKRVSLARTDCRGACEGVGWVPKVLSLVGFYNTD
jgi:hypothetical protein